MFAEDTSVYFDTTTGFAQLATLNGVAVTGIFDSAYDQGIAGGMAMASTMPAFTLPTASVPTDPVGLPVVVSGVSYTVAECRSDGTGVSVLYLERLL